MLEIEPEELQLELVKVEPDKNKLDELTEQYNRMNQKLDIILERIKYRKKKVSGVK